MSIQPKGEELRKAIRWISENRKENPKINLMKLVEQACITFDITPKDEEFLIMFVLQKEKHDN